MGLKYSVVWDNELLSRKVMENIPKTCECGAEIEFTETLRQVYCGNKECLYKIASRLESMADKMDADGFGFATCVEVVKQFELKSPYEVFLLEKYVGKNQTVGISAFDNKITGICDREKRRVELWEVVKYAGLPSVETTAYKIFKGFKNLGEAYEKIESGEVSFVASLLGIQNTESSVMALSIYNTLIEYKSELLFGESQFEVYEPEGKNLTIAITGGVEGYKSKGEFMSYLNERYQGKLNFLLVNTVTQDLDILLADGDTGSTKFKKAEKINEKGGRKIVVTGSKEVIVYLDGMVR